ncbi:hypothetical protein L195_g054038 [Trifolium pratense]|uniref:Uncharacterized protein n=1 Tax=Trifolium pratense TaxID=57577 RepID=A0A2K3KDW7_TRIPR|nr:hypothetical protein L195_g054038 [Trifolium pratense]
MKRSSKRIAEAQKKKKSEEKEEQKQKEKVKPEIIILSSDSEKADSDYAKFLTTYDSDEEDSSEVQSKLREKTTEEYVQSS